MILDLLSLCIDLTLGKRPTLEMTKALEHVSATFLMPCDAGRREENHFRT